MRTLFVLVMLFATLALAQAQSYSPKPGETVIKMAIEGRGNVFIKLHTDKAPKATSHILGLVRRGFYDNMRFHKVSKSPRPYLVQLGDPATKNGDVDIPGTGGSGARIPYEDTGFSNEVGAVGLATQSGDKNSGDSQFYIVMGPATFLDGDFTVFGKVVAGMDVVRKIERGDRILSVTIAS